MSKLITTTAGVLVVSVISAVCAQTPTNGKARDHADFRDLPGQAKESS
jgi:hypothetical protein